MSKFNFNSSQLKIGTPFLLFIFLAISFLIYFPALKCGFELDAHYVVENNPLIKHSVQLEKIFQKGFFDAYKNSFNPQLNYYRPITILSFALNYHWLGKEPLSFRLVNILIHGCNSFLVFLFVYLFFKRKELGLVAGLLFCLLPTHEWVVNYIVGRGDLLQALFSLGALILFVAYLSQDKIYIYLLSLLCFMLALLSREAAILFPLIVTITAWFYFQLLRSKDSLNVRTMNQYLSKVQSLSVKGNKEPSIVSLSLPFYIIAFVYYLYRQMYFPIADASLELFSFLDVFKWIKICLLYNLRFIFPWSLFSSFSFIINNVWFCLILIIAIMISIYKYLARKRAKESVIVFWLSFAWLVVGCISFWPTRLAFAKQGYYLAEHFLYFSSIGFVLVVSYVILSLEGRKRIYVLLALCVFYGAVTFTSSRFWTTEENLLRRVFQKEKSKQGVAYRQLIYRFDENVPAMKEMIIKSQNDSERSLWSKQLGAVYRKQNKIEDAVKMLKQSIDYDPSNLEAMLELAVCYLNHNELKEGKVWLEKIIEQDPENSEAYRVLGEALYHHKQYTQAAKNLEKALSLDPDYETIWQFLALAYYFDNQKDEYLRILTHIEKYSSNIHEVMKFFIKEYYGHGQTGQVIDLVQENSKMFERDAETLNVLASAFFNSGKKEKGREVWKYILTFEPQNKDALHGMMAP